MPSAHRLTQAMHLPARLCLAPSFCPQRKLPCFFFSVLTLNTLNTGTRVAAVAAQAQASALSEKNKSYMPLEKQTLLRPTVWNPLGGTKEKNQEAGRGEAEPATPPLPVPQPIDF